MVVHRETADATSNSFQLLLMALINSAENPSFSLVDAIAVVVLFR